MSAINHGTKVPADSRREVLMGYQYALHDAWLMTSPLGTPRGRCDEYSSKVFPQLRNQGMSIRRGETID
jgi:hypothetical protein